MLALRLRQFIGLHFKLTAQLGHFLLQGLDLIVQIQLCLECRLNPLVDFAVQLVDLLVQGFEAAHMLVKAAAQFNNGFTRFFVIEQCGTRWRCCAKQGDGKKRDDKLADDKRHDDKRRDQEPGNDNRPDN